MFSDCDDPYHEEEHYPSLPGSPTEYIINAECGNLWHMSDILVDFEYTCDTTDTIFNVSEATLEMCSILNDIGELFPIHFCEESTRPYPGFPTESINEEFDIDSYEISDDPDNVANNYEANSPTQEKDTGESKLQKFVPQRNHSSSDAILSVSDSTLEMCATLSDIGEPFPIHFHEESTQSYPGFPTENTNEEFYIDSYEISVYPEDVANNSESYSPIQEKDTGGSELQKHAPNTNHSSRKTRSAIFNISEETLEMCATLSGIGEPFPIHFHEESTQSYPGFPTENTSEEFYIDLYEISDYPKDVADNSESYSPIQEKDTGGSELQKHAPNTNHSSRETRSAIFNISEETLEMCATLSDIGEPFPIHFCEESTQPYPGFPTECINEEFDIDSFEMSDDPGAPVESFHNKQSLQQPLPGSPTENLSKRKTMDDDYYDTDDYYCNLCPKKAFGNKRLCTRFLWAYPKLPDVTNMVYVPPMIDNEFPTLQQRIYQILKAYPCCTNGISKVSILSHFTQEQHGDVHEAIDYLASEGYLYTTVDYNHFKLLK